MRNTPNHFVVNIALDIRKEGVEDFIIMLKKWLKDNRRKKGAQSQLFKELDKMFGELASKCTQSQLDILKNKYPLAYAFVEVL